MSGKCRCCTCGLLTFWQAYPMSCCFSCCLVMCCGALKALRKSRHNTILQIDPNSSATVADAHQ